MTLNVDRLFVHTLRDLSERSTATDEYTVLMSAALLRKLFLDQDRLIDQANRAHRIKLHFRIGGVSPFERSIHERGPMFWVIEDALDPDCAIAHEPYDATMDQFLKRQVMSFNGTLFTIRDVITQLANIEGAVHSGNAKNQKQQALQEAANFYGRAGLPGALSQIRLIGKIAVRGLTPLRNAVVASGGATWASVNSTGSIEVCDDDS